MLCNKNAALEDVGRHFLYLLFTVVLSVMVFLILHFLYLLK